MDQNKKTKYRIEIEDRQIQNHTYAEEQVMWDLIRMGDIEGVLKHQKAPKLKYPLLIVTNPKKNEEYMAVASITIMARIAIEEGITSSESFLVSDVYLKQIAECKTEEEILKVVDEAQIAYTKMIKAYKESRTSNIYVEDCKKAIVKNLFKNISLSDIAADIGVQPAYLSRLFTKHEGMTVTDYIHQQKIEVSQNMLKYSDRSIAEIADYLGFNSQSYYGKLFKEVTGMTPLVYRTMYHPPEF